MSGPPAISRRRTLGLLGLLGLGLGVTGGCGAVGPGFAPLRGEPLREPVPLASVDGRLAVELVAAPGAAIAGRPAAAWGYNGTVPGPTLLVRPGDELVVRLHNGLDGPTNLHTHGLRVSPEGAGDNPFVHVAPGTSADYRIRIPRDHPTGTFWYHPHAHGHVAEQVFAGLAGALVVTDGPTPGVSADRVLLVGDTTLDAAGRPVTEAPGPMVMTGRRGELLLFDGQVEPVLDAAVGQVQRWRIVNATASRTLTLRLEAHRLLRVAVDGITLPRPEVLDAVRLAPGNRTDVLVRPERSGSWALTAVTSADGMGMGGRPSGTGDVTDVVLASVRTTGADWTMAPFPVLAAPAPVPAGPVVARRRLVLTGGMGPGGMVFGIDGRPFDPARTDVEAAAGSVEEWIVENRTAMSHPFHLHTWPVVALDDSAGTPVTGAPRTWSRSRRGVGCVCGWRSWGRWDPPSTTATSSTTRTRG